MNNKPLVSFCMKSFNQKEYFKLALKAAFAQTYDNLEIVISDNHSTDGSDEMIRSMIDQYMRNGGKHKIVYKYNDKNIGHVRNTEQMVRMSHGELCIQADGDDISFPERASVIVDEWLRFGKTASVISSGRIEIDPAGNCIGVHGADSPLQNVGCSMAYIPAVVKSFPCIDNGVLVDDKVLGLRGLILGNHCQINKPLLFYRVGNGISTSLFHYRESRARSATAVLSGLRFMRATLDGEKKLDAQRRKYIEDLLDGIEDRYVSESVLVSGNRFVKRFQAFRKYAKAVRLKKATPSYWLCYLPMVLPPAIGNLITDFYSRMKYRQRIRTHGNIVFPNCNPAQD